MEPRIKVRAKNQISSVDAGVCESKISLDLSN